MYQVKESDMIVIKSLSLIFIIFYKTKIIKIIFYLSQVCSLS